MSIQVSDPVQKLKADASTLLHEAESSPQFQHDQEVAKERRMAQMVRCNNHKHSGKSILLILSSSWSSFLCQRL